MVISDLLKSARAGGMGSPQVDGTLLFGEAQILLVAVPRCHTVPFHGVTGKQTVSGWPVTRALIRGVCLPTAGSTRWDVDILAVWTLAVFSPSRQRACSACKLQAPRFSRGTPISECGEGESGTQNLRNAGELLGCIALGFSLLFSS